MRASSTWLWELPAFWCRELPSSRSERKDRLISEEHAVIPKSLKSNSMKGTDLEGQGHLCQAASEMPDCQLPQTMTISKAGNWLTLVTHSHSSVNRTQTQEVLHTQGAHPLPTAMLPYRTSSFSPKSQQGLKKCE